MLRRREALPEGSGGYGGLSSYLLRCAAIGITVEICVGLAPVSGQVSRPRLIAFLNEAVIFFESLRLCLQLVQMDCQPYNSAGDCREEPRQAVIRQREQVPYPRNKQGKAAFADSVRERNAVSRLKAV